MLPYYLLPIWASVFIDDFGFSGAQLGPLLAADMIGGTIAALIARRWITSADWPSVLRWTVSACVLANFACALMDTFAAMLFLRSIAGLAAGSFMAIVYADFAHAENPDREFSIALALQVLLGIFAIWLAPYLADRWGASTSFLMIGIATLTPLAFAGACSQPIAPGDDDVGARRAQLPVMLGLTTIALFFLSLTCVWVAMERIALAGGNDQTVVTMVLSVGLVFSFLGAAAPSFFVALAPRKTQIIFSYGALAVAIMVIAVSETPWLLAAGIAVYNFFFSFVIPYQTAWIAETDESGRNAVLVPFAQGIGVSIGPLLGGIFLGSGNTKAVIYVSLALLAVSATFARLANDPVRT